MHPKHYMLLALTGLLTLTSWQFKTINHIHKASWLIGTWENKTSDGSVFETWSKVNADEMFGLSYTLNGTDTVVFEKIQMIQEKDSLFYIPTVKNQNDELPIQFVMTRMTEKSMTFEHPYHDFPQMIQYVNISKDSLEATISGFSNGEELIIVIPMKRIL